MSLTALTKALQARARWLVIAVPHLWLDVFFLVPFLILLKLSVTESGEGTELFAQMIKYVDGVLQMRLKLSNYVFIWSDNLYFLTYLRSIGYAAVTTVLCLLIGYPFAYSMARAPAARRPGLLMLVMLPFWTSFLVRVYAWMGLLDSEGLINHALLGLGLIDQPLQLLHTAFSVQLVMVYTYLPFMILPLYSNLVKLDGRLLEAAADLGCKPWRAFVSVTLPLSKNGIVAGAMLVFIPAVGEFVIPELVGTPESLMIGKVLWMEFFDNNNWPMAAAVTTTMLALLIAPIVYLHRREEKALARAQR